MRYAFIEEQKNAALRTPHVQSAERFGSGVLRVARASAQRGRSPTRRFTRRSNEFMRTAGARTGGHESTLSS